jgi:hypothetical protein
MRFKTFVIFVVLIIIAFGLGYGWGYWKLHLAEQDWSATKAAMEEKINRMEKDLVKAKAWQALRNLSGMLDEAMDQYAEKNFGLAMQTIDKMKETFREIQLSVPEDVKGRLSFLLPALDEVRQEIEKMGPDVKKKAKEVQDRIEAALRPAKKT